MTLREYSQNISGESYPAILSFNHQLLPLILC